MTCRTILPKCYGRVDMKCCHTFSIKIVFTMCRGLLFSTVDVVKCRCNSLLSWLDIREYDRDKSVQALKLSRSTLKCHWRDSSVTQHRLQIAGATTYVLHVKQSCLLFIAEKEICWDVEDADVGASNSRCVMPCGF